MHHVRIIFISLVAIFIGFLMAIMVASNKLITIPSLEKKPVENFVKTQEDKLAPQIISDVFAMRQSLTGLAEKQKRQEADITKIQQSVAAVTAPSGAPSAKKSVIGAVNAVNGSYTTTSGTYGAMGVYTNIRCPVGCNLWINFMTTTRNQVAGYVNSYEVFVNSSDQSVGSEVNLTSANMSTPLSINALIPAGVGTHTVEIRAKTTGGTLESRNSYLQVMAIEK